MTAPRIITGDDVRDAVQATLTTHLPPVLEALGPLRGDLGPLPMPRSHEAPTVDAARLDAAQLPILVVAVPGFAGPPERDHEGVYTAPFDCLIDFLIRSEEGTYEATARDVRIYAAAIRTVLIEQSSLDGFAWAVQLVDESYDDGEARAARTLAQGEVTCVVTVTDINRIGTTFTDPTASPSVEATETHVTVEPV